MSLHIGARTLNADCETWRDEGQKTKISAHQKKRLVCACVCVCVCVNDWKDALFSYIFLKIYV